MPFFSVWYLGLIMAWPWQFGHTIHSHEACRRLINILVSNPYLFIQFKSVKYASKWPVQCYMFYHWLLISRNSVSFYVTSASLVGRKHAVSAVFASPPVVEEQWQTVVRSPYVLDSDPLSPRCCDEDHSPGGLNGPPFLCTYEWHWKLPFASSQAYYL